jgi:hypothetical protein
VAEPNPPEKRKVAGSIPALATQIVAVQKVFVDDEQSAGSLATSDGRRDEQ